MNKIKEAIGNIFQNQTQKTIVFFGFYFIFFVILFLLISHGDKNYLKQEYERGKDTPQVSGTLGTNFLFDYQIMVDDNRYDYYGKRYGDTESFKFNQLDYYRDEDQFYVHQDTWNPVENPYVFYEFLDFKNLYSILGNATYFSTEDQEDGGHLYHYLISSNTLHQILYENITDYDDVANTIDITTDSSDHIVKISLQLDSMCHTIDSCQEKFSILLNFDMIGKITALDNPVS